MMHILAHAHRSYEFQTADAINDMGGFAVVPRKVEIVTKDGKTDYEYRPFLPNFIFCALTEEQWHTINRKRLFGLKGILPPIRKELDILARSWGDFQGFAERSETECSVRIEKFETGQKVARYRKGDMIRIIGADMLDGQLKDKLARFLKINGAGQIEAEVQGVEMFGKPVQVRLGPGDVMAAE